MQSGKEYDIKKIKKETMNSCNYYESLLSDRN